MLTCLLSLDCEVAPSPSEKIRPLAAYQAVPAIIQGALEEAPTIPAWKVCFRPDTNARIWFGRLRTKESGTVKQVHGLRSE